MADLSVTAANVGVTSSAVVELVQVGESVTQGQPGYKKALDGLYYKADANASSATAAALGVFITAASTNGYALIVKSGSYLAGATLTVGETYVVSATAGGIAPLADVTTGWYVTILGVASSATTLSLDIVRSGTARA
jgi:hypothetical protein